MIGGSIVALVTPFLNDKKIDYDSLDKLCSFHVDNKTDGLLLLGTTAEAEALTTNEKKELVDFVLKRVGGIIPIMVGIISNKQNEVIDYALLFNEYPIDAYLVISPYYTKTNNKGLVEYFNTISKRCSHPIIIYNVPKRTGMNIPLDVIIELSKNPKIIGIKDASGDITLQMSIVQIIPDFLYYSGDDQTALASIMLGANGWINVIGNLYPYQCSKIYNEKNKDLFYDIYSLIKALPNEVSPIGIKYLMYKYDMITLSYRPPLYYPSNEFKALLLEMIN